MYVEKARERTNKGRAANQTYVLLVAVLKVRRTGFKDNKKRQEKGI